MQLLFWILLAVAAVYLLILLFVYYQQSSIIYHPQQAIVTTPESVGVPFEEVYFETEDELTLHGWFISVDSTAPTVLFFHGNAGNISGRMETLKLFHRLGLNAFIFDYRGYGQSEGRTTEKGTYRDATAAWDYLISERDIPKENIIIMGRSLGGSIAAWLSARVEPVAVVLESTFTSAADIAQDIYPWLPVRWLLKYRYNTMANLDKINAPVLITHGREDQVIPFHHGRQLMDAAKEPKAFIELSGAHGTGFLETGELYRKNLKKFLEVHTSYGNKVTE